MFDLPFMSGFFPHDILSLVVLLFLVLMYGGMVAWQIFNRSRNDVFQYQFVGSIRQVCFWTPVNICVGCVTLYLTIRSGILFPTLCLVVGSVMAQGVHHRRRLSLRNRRQFTPVHHLVPWPQWVIWLKRQTLWFSLSSLAVLFLCQSPWLTQYIEQSPSSDTSMIEYQDGRWHLIQQSLRYGSNVIVIPNPTSTTFPSIPTRHLQIPYDNVHLKVLPYGLVPLQMTGESLNHLFISANHVNVSNLQIHKRINMTSLESREEEQNTSHNFALQFIRSLIGSSDYELDSLHVRPTWFRLLQRLLPKEVFLSSSSSSSSLSAVSPALLVTGNTVELNNVSVRCEYTVQEDEAFIKLQDWMEEIKTLSFCNENDTMIQIETDKHKTEILIQLDQLYSNTQDNPYGENLPRMDRLIEMTQSIIQTFPCVNLRSETIMQGMRVQLVLQNINRHQYTWRINMETSKHREKSVKPLGSFNKESHDLCDFPCERKASRCSLCRSIVQQVDNVSHKKTQETILLSFGSFVPWWIHVEYHFPRFLFWSLSSVSRVSGVAAVTTSHLVRALTAFSILSLHKSHTFWRTKVIPNLVDLVCGTADAFLLSEENEFRTMETPQFERLSVNATKDDVLSSGFLWHFYDRICDVNKTESTLSFLLPSFDASSSLNDSEVCSMSRQTFRFNVSQKVSQILRGIFFLFSLLPSPFPFLSVIFNFISRFISPIFTFALNLAKTIVTRVVSLSLWKRIGWFAVSILSQFAVISFNICYRCVFWLTDWYLAYVHLLVGWQWNVFEWLLTRIVQTIQLGSWLLGPVTSVLKTILTLYTSAYATTQLSVVIAQSTLLLAAYLVRYEKMVQATSPHSLFPPLFVRTTVLSQLVASDGFIMAQYLLIHLAVCFIIAAMKFVPFIAGQRVNILLTHVMLPFMSVRTAIDVLATRGSLQSKTLDDRLILRAAQDGTLTPSEVWLMLTDDCNSSTTPAAVIDEHRRALNSPMLLMKVHSLRLATVMLLQLTLARIIESVLTELIFIGFVTAVGLTLLLTRSHIIHFSSMLFEKMSQLLLPTIDTEDSLTNSSQESSTN